MTNDTIVQALNDPRVMDITLVGKDGRGVHIRRLGSAGGFKVWAEHLSTNMVIETAEEAVAVAQNRYFNVRPRETNKERS